MYLKREIEPILKKISKQFACVTIYGSRQVGKSTLVRTIFNDFNYVTLDNLDDLSLATSNPKLFLEMYPYPVIIDEIQRVPSLLPLIKKNIDDYKFNNLNNDKANSLIYVLTGSNQFNLKKSVSESLAGRTALLNLASLSYREINKYSDSSLFNPDIDILRTKGNIEKYRERKEIFEDIFQGGMPEYLSGNIDRDFFFSSYIKLYLERDVRNLINPNNLVTFNRFLRFIALRTASEINYTDIANSIGISTQTVKEWLSILKESGIIVLLEPYMKNMSNRIVKVPKLYFMDTGLCAYLCKWPTASMLEDGVMNRAFYETYVVSELFKNYYNNGVNPEDYIYYYRDRDQKEVDIIIDGVDKIYPIEIKKGINPIIKIKNFSFLSKYNKEIKPALIIGGFEKIRPISENLYYVPIGYIGK